MNGLCPSLPSAEVAYELVQEGPRALPGVLGTVSFRTMLIGAGIGLASRGQDRPHLFRDAVFAALAVEAFVVGWAYYQTRTSS